uniref:Uncharacterized protein n=2 Tax=Oreochromis TaxID=8139 RepID=A0A669CP12_ORENI
NQTLLDIFLCTRDSPRTAVYNFVRCNPDGDQANCVTQQSPEMEWSPDLPTKLPASAKGQGGYSWSKEIKPRIVDDLFLHKTQKYLELKSADQFCSTFTSSEMNARNVGSFSAQEII